MEQEQLKLACLRVSGGLFDHKLSLVDLHPHICAVVSKQICPQESAVFFGKWFRTTGRAFEKQPMAGVVTVDIALSEVTGKDVVFVERAGADSKYLLDGIAIARAADARSIGVLSPRRHFLKEELLSYRDQLSWVMLTDHIEDQMPRFNQLCPGIITTLPYLRSRQGEAVFFN